MGYELIVTEKPSAALKIATALADNGFKKENLKGAPYYQIKHKNKSIVVSCAVGHLYTIAEKKKTFTYPVFDIGWKPTYKVDKSSKYSKKYLDLIVQLSKNAASFTVACDYDIEGEVIGLNCIRYACQQKDAARMKFSTLTKGELLQSYNEKEKHLDWGQAHAGETRHKLDWLYGINLSRALTLAIRKTKHYKTLSSGRVQGPALKIIVEKEKEIQKFVPKKYWQLQLLGKIKNHKIEAWHEKNKFWDEEECKKIMKKVKGHNGIVSSLLKTKLKQLPPYPFDLTTLQTEAYKVFGISPKQTLSLAQELYLAGLISYPRTSSQKLPYKLGFKKILNELSKQLQYKKFTEKLLETTLNPRQGSKEDPAHPAIYPTGEIKELRAGEKKIYDLVVRRFFACFGESAVRQTIKMDIDINSEMFIAKGTSTIVAGWHVFYEPYLKQEENLLPGVNQGDKVDVDKIVKHNKETQPPKRYTPASIIKELETRNLGTKATRSAIIDSLYQRDYITDRSIEATELGIQTIDILYKYCPEIIDEELTRTFEEDMEKIRDNKVSPTNVLNNAEKELTKILEKFRQKEVLIGRELAQAYKETLDEENQIGQCPKCKTGTLRLIHSKKTRQRFIACDKYPKCKTIFNIPQNGKIKSTEKTCPHCNLPLIEIINKKRHIVCINPECKSKEIKDKEIKKEAKEMEKGIVEEQCPRCKQGVMVVRQSVYGKFLGCSRFPKCRYVQKIPAEPIKEDFSNKR
ncbi:DNA topoisomerase I [Candidatus Woesearchaeota archaeon]|nr:DNA topoisomerase I [Candidatus Woesearchaeota archaeon]